jgi:hypothetical protein
MSRTWVQIKALAAQRLQDTGMGIYNTTELDQYEDEANAEVSRFSPRYEKYTLTATTSSKEFTLLAEHLRNMICIGLIQDPYIEYKVDQNPMVKRNFIRVGNKVIMKINSYPTSGDSAYLFIGKKHILPKITLTDLAGAVVGAHIAGVTSLAVNGLGSEAYVPEDTTFLIAGDTTVYTVTADATISTNAATLSIYPALAVGVSGSEVVTFTNPVISLDYYEENLLVDMICALAATNKAAYMYSQINKSIGDITRISSVISELTDRIDQTVTDINSGRVEAAKIAAVVDLANTEVDKIATVVAQASTDLNSGRALIGEIDNAGMVSRYISTANAGVNAARSGVDNAAGYFREAVTRGDNAGVFLNMGSKELAVANIHMSEISAYGNKINHEIQISNTGRLIQSWGESLYQKTVRKLNSRMPSRIYEHYSEG